jgi:hypothetical protein
MTCFENEKNYEAFCDVLSKLSLFAPSEDVRLLALKLGVALDEGLADSENSDLLVEIFD